jgi:hypothetical protein
VLRRLMAIFAVALMALSGGMILAQRRGPVDEGKQRDIHIRFDVRDRENVGHWYKNHFENLPPGFQSQDRLTPSAESRLRIGEALDPDLQSMLTPVASDLMESLPPAAPGYSYETLDGHLLLLQAKNFNVLDVLHFETDFGRP